MHAGREKVMVKVKSALEYPALYAKIRVVDSLFPVISGDFKAFDHI